MGTVVYVNPEARIDAPAIHIGVDIGQKHDPTAIVVAEIGERDSGRVRTVDGYRDRYGHFHSGHSTPIMETTYTARFLKRLPLGMGYPDVAEYVAGVVCNERMRGRMRRVLMDATGVGQPVYELVRDAIMARPGHSDVWIRPITFTSGDSYDRSSGRMGKAYLVSRLQRLLQTRCIELPAQDPEAHALALEIENYEIHVDQDGKDTYGAFKMGTHDDLATALGLACLEDPAEYRVTSIPFAW